MSTTLGKTVSTLAPPALLLGGAGAALAMGRDWPASVAALLPFAPWAAAAAGALLAWHFKSGRMVLALALVALGHALLDGPLGGGAMRGAWGQVAFALYAVLLPLNLVALAWLPERGLLSMGGLWRAGVLGLQAGAAWWLTTGAPPGVGATVADLLRARLLDPKVDAWTWLPQPALFAFAVAFAVLLVRALRNRDALDGGFLGVLAAVAAALHSVGPGPAPDLFLLAAGLVAIAAVVQEGWRMAFLDELTGLPGRRALVAETRQLGSRYTLAMADVDHFKKFNDTHGHDVGDDVLRMVAGCLAKVSGGGRAFRYGGEEFTVLFPGRDGEHARPHLDALRAAIESSPFRLRGKGDETVSVTISIGMAERAPRETPEQTLKAADEALYRAKQAGRNRVSD